MDLFKIVFEFAKEKGTLSTLTILLFCTISIVIVFNAKKDVFKNLWKRIFGKKNTIFDQTKLLDHHLFYQLRRYINRDIQYFSLSEKLREALFKDLLLFKFTAIQKAYLSFLLKGDMEQLSQSAFHNKMSEIREDIIKAYETKALEEKMPLIVLEKFNEWHKDRIDAIYNWIDLVCEEEIYSTNAERTKVIFDFIVHINNQTILDAKKTLINLNGALNNVTYKGITYKSTQ